MIELDTVTRADVARSLQLKDGRTITQEEEAVIWNAFDTAFHKIFQVLKYEHMPQVCAIGLRLMGVWSLVFCLCCLLSLLSFVFLSFVFWLFGFWPFVVSRFSFCLFIFLSFYLFVFLSFCLFVSFVFLSFVFCLLSFVFCLLSFVFCLGLGLDCLGLGLGLGLGLVVSCLVSSSVSLFAVRG